MTRPSCHPAFHRFLICAFLLWPLLPTPPVAAQVAHVSTFHEARFVHSGRYDGGAGKPSVAWRETVMAPGSPWIRVRLGGTLLGEASQLVIRSREDGDAQVLDARALRNWDGHSAYFNGDTVDLELHVGPGDRGVFVEVDRVTFSERPVPEENGGVLPKSICGNFDDRVPSNDPRVARLLFSSGFCTGWLLPNNLGASAGHCGDPDGNYAGAVMQFDVPPSLADGTAVMPPADKQYPVDSNSVSFEANGQGDDWAVFVVNPNGTTNLRAHDVRGWFKLTSTLPPSAATLRVTGNGLDADPPGPTPDNCNDGNDACNSSSLTQQTDTGSWDGLDGEAIEHHVDTMPANSGSPVIWDANGYAIAIHTDGGCDSVFSEFDNAGTWFGDTNLAVAIDSYNPAGRRWVDVDSPTVVQFGSVIYPFLNMAAAVANVPDGADVQIYTGDYPSSSGNTFTAGDDGRAMTFSAVWGTVVIGN